MKKSLIALIIFVALLGASFMWLLAQSSPDNANSDIIQTELPDSFEK